MTYYFYNPFIPALFFTRIPDQDKPHGTWLLTPTTMSREEVLECYAWAREIKNPQPYYQA